VYEGLHNTTRQCQLLELASDTINSKLKEVAEQIAVMRIDSALYHSKAGLV
jgi:hypothetical protein